MNVHCIEISIIMKLKYSIINTIVFLALSGQVVSAQVGKPFIHDPSTILQCDGKYYTFGTRGGGLVSEDGWRWDSGGIRPGGGAAPDMLKIGNRYLVVYGATGGGLGGGHNGKILTMWNNTLDPKSPDFKYSEAVVVAASDGVEDNDAIDPGLLLDPTDGRLWLSYGTYFGFIRLIELDPTTGKRKAGNIAKDIAIDCEATTMMYREGWYYLLGTHGTCCDGANSTYNIVVGRSKKVTGPYLDNMGRDMLKGGGKMVIAAGGRVNGPGHFGLFDFGDGVQKMSCHYEADLDQSGRSVLGIRPLLWENGWPVAGDLFKEGTYEIESERRGYALELVVDFTRMPGGMRGFNYNNNEPVKSIPSQQLADVIQSWPKGNIGVRTGDYMFRPHQKWTITAVPEAGGYLGGPYFKIVIAGTERALAATSAAELVTVPIFTGAAEQLWRIDQLIDGTYRIMPKTVPNSNKQLALVSSGDSSPTLAEFDMNSDNSKWNFRSH